MSYDVMFWRQATPLTVAAPAVYDRLATGDLVPELVPLPVDAILAALREAFPDLDVARDAPRVRTSEGFIEIRWSAHHFHFDFRGICDDCQKVVDVMARFDCPMYDPQEARRYDDANGTQLGTERPLFRDATPDERDAIRRIRNEPASNFQSQRPGGCAKSAAMLIFGVAAAVWASLRFA